MFKNFNKQTKESNATEELILVLNTECFRQKCDLKILKEKFEIKGNKLLFQQIPTGKS